MCTMISVRKLLINKVVVFHVLTIGFFGLARSKTNVKNGSVYKRKCRLEQTSSISSQTRLDLNNMWNREHAKFGQFEGIVHFILYYLVCVYVFILLNLFDFLQSKSDYISLKEEQSSLTGKQTGQKLGHLKVDQISYKKRLIRSIKHR